MKINNVARISIVIINYNGVQYLRETIPIFLSQDYTNFEVIVVDNGSQDESIHFLSQCSGVKIVKSPRLREKNFACNYGIQHAQGEYIFLCDNDLLLSGASVITQLYEMYTSFDRIGALGVAYANKGENTTIGYGNYLGYYYTKEKKAQDFTRVAAYHGHEISFPSGIGFFIEKKLWDDLGGYDDNLKFGGDDSDIGIRLCLLGYKNYLYANTIQWHIGMAERADNKKFQLKFQEMFLADMYTIVKTFSVVNMCITLCIYSGYYFLRAVKQSVFRGYFGPLYAYFLGYVGFMKMLPIALEKRKMIQAQRKVGQDSFLHIDF